MISMVGGKVDMHRGVGHDENCISSIGWLVVLPGRFAKRLEAVQCGARPMMMVTGMAQLMAGVVGLALGSVITGNKLGYLQSADGVECCVSSGGSSGWVELRQSCFSFAWFGVARVWVDAGERTSIGQKILPILDSKHRLSVPVCRLMVWQWHLATLAAAA
jgi:hypothetical protein